MRSVAPAAVATDEAEAIRAAAAWYARLCSGLVGDTEHAAWQDWLAASELHRRAWQRVENLCLQLGRVPGDVAGPALQGAADGRRKALRTLTVLALGGPLLGWLGYRLMPWPAWQADYRTAVGERRRIVLADGGVLVLDSDSAVDIVYDAAQRLIRLHAGRLLLTSAPDPARRPLRVGTVHGSAEALGTRFTVQLESAFTTVAVLDQAVRVTPAEAPVLARELKAGQQLRFDAAHLADSERADPAAGTWTDGSLLAVDMPLARLAAELGRYRHGVVTCDAAIAGLKVSGAFPLDDTDRALALLADTFPVRLRRRTRYWVQLLPR